MKTHRLYWAVLSAHRSSAILVVAASTAAGILEALGLASLLPVVGQSGSSSDSLYRAFALLGALLVCSVLARGVADVKLAELNIAVESRLRKQFLDSLMEARWSALREARSGDLVTALMSESSQVANGAGAYLASLAAFSIALCLAVTALAVAPLVSLLVVIFAGVSSIAYRRAGMVSRNNQAALAVAAADMNEEAIGLLGNLKMLLSTGDRATWLTRMRGRLAGLMVLRRRDLVLPVMTRTAVEALGAGFLVSTMALTVLGGGHASTALITLALFYRVVPRLQVGQSSFLLARTQSAWWGRWLDREERWREAADRSSGGIRMRFAGPLKVVELEGIEVTYPGRSNAALRVPTLRLSPGRVLAIVGGTGSGKSTLLDVVTGLITPGSGRCLVNGVSLEDTDLDSWQRQIGFVPQEAPVLHGSLLDNVVWLEERSDPEWASWVLRVAALDDFVAELPTGLSCEVGPRAASISGGQRQRLAIARALYRRPSLLILDEATSSLDPATERRLLTNLIEHCRDIAVIIVTHRLDTVALADDVILLEEGELVADSLAGARRSGALGRISAAAAVEQRP